MPKETIPPIRLPQLHGFQIVRPSNSRRCRAPSCELKGTLPAYEADNMLGRSQWGASNQAEISKPTSQVSPCSHRYTQHRARKPGYPGSFHFLPSAHDMREGVKMARRDVLGQRPALPWPEA